MKKTTTKSKDKETTMDLPEVKDIPGQEHVRPPRIREMEDSTASSDDEEATDLLDTQGTEEEALMDDKTNVTDIERELLDKTDRPDTDEDKDLEKLALDTDDEDEALNQQGDPLDMGQDLDIPGSELDDENEEIGEEDEENNSYSRPD